MTEVIRTMVGASGEPVFALRTAAQTIGVLFGAVLLLGGWLAFLLRRTPRHQAGRRRR